VYYGHVFSQQFLANHMCTEQKWEKLVSNQTDSSVRWMSGKSKKVEMAGRGPLSRKIEGPLLAG